MVGVLEPVSAVFQVRGDVCPRRSRQVTAGPTYNDRKPFTLTFTSQDNLEFPVHLPPQLHVSGCVGGSQSTQREARQERGEPADSPQESPELGF